MASIIKRKKTYCVVYNYTTNEGKKMQKWETFATNAEAKKRKRQVEYELENGTFVIPNATTLNELLDEYMNVYGARKWAIATYNGHRGLIENYIRPIIGDKKLQDLTSHAMDKYYNYLCQYPSVSTNHARKAGEYVTPSTIREVHKLLRNAFNQAVKWGLMEKNPVQNAILPKEEKVIRDIWTADILFKALELCDDDNLSLAINLSFACSLRMGELLGLTWKCVDISEESIKNNCAYLYVDKELQRVNNDALAKLGEKDIIFKFPPIFSRNHTTLVLKAPKTQSSVRKIFLPRTVAQMLVERRNSQLELQELFGEEYVDYDLVFAGTVGRPIENQIINRALKKLIDDNDLPRVVFHSFRHSSITYKLKLSGGDIKSVQGDSGHSQVKMVTDHYSHIIEDDRRLNAQLFENTFYSGKSTDSIPEKVPSSQSNIVETESSDKTTDMEMMLKLLQNPEMAALLKTLAKNL